MANFMLDYDGTYTLDPEMWRSIIPIILISHEMYLVTSRGMDTPIELVQDFVEWKIPIVYCNYRAKKEVCEEQGIHIDVWIDDNPYYITTGFVGGENVYVPKLLFERMKDTS